MASAADPTVESPINGASGDPRTSFGAADSEPPPSAAPAVQPAVNEHAQKIVEEVLYSDIGVNTLLTRLKQSIASARDFASFLKKRSSLEEEHAQGLKKLCRSTHEQLRRSETRGGSYATQYESVTRINERMADNGMQFALSLHQMHEDLNELSNNMERGRKHWKTQGLSWEKKAQDMELLLEKAKAKYDGLAEDLDRVKTGDQTKGKLFGIKGPRNAAQHEEDLQRKVQAADSDYQNKVSIAQSTRQELVSTLRPQAVKAIQELITECDAALTLQLQKFAYFNEKLLLANGILVAPIGSPNSGEQPQQSLRDLVNHIDNDKDFRDYVSSFHPKVSKPAEIIYVKHPTLASQQPTPTANRQSQPPTQLPTQAPPPQPPAQPAFGGRREPSPPPASSDHPGYNNPSYPPPQQSHAQPPPPAQPPQPGQSMSPYGSRAPQLNIPSLGTSQFPSSPSFVSTAPPQPAQDFNSSQQQTGVLRSNGPSSNVPMKPVFGVSLEELFRRDGSPVPMVVYQCIQAVELYGMDVEGIYRINGTAQHIQEMKIMFDHDASKVDFRNPETFYHDVNSVAGLLKQFFRDLPDPLFTSERYAEFINAARIDDDVVRRDTLHALINELPDPNYATLRAVILHLFRVQERAATNRMSTSNLAICFAPTLMGQHRGPMSDAGLQARVVDTVLQNCWQIFDED